MFSSEFFRAGLARLTRRNLLRVAGMAAAAQCACELISKDCESKPAAKRYRDEGVYGVGLVAWASSRREGELPWGKARDRRPHQKYASLFSFYQRLLNGP